MAAVDHQVQTAIEQQGVPEDQVTVQEPIDERVHRRRVGVYPGGEVVLVTLEAVSPARPVGVGDTDAGDG